MKLNYWLKPGAKVKRWMFLGLMGIVFIFFGVLETVNKRYFGMKYIAFYILIISAGIFIVYISVTQFMKSILTLINSGYLNVSLKFSKLGDLIYEKRLLVKGPKIVAIGGGTGLSTMLRGLKHYTSNITAIVTVADDGGGSGMLREDLGMLAPGDIRNCIMALADTEPVMKELLQYRFKDGRLKDQSFGNLFLAAMDGISSNFEEAVQKMSYVLAVTGKVIPVTLDNMILKARLKNGDIIQGESQIPKEAIKRQSPIDQIFIEPRNAKALEEAVLAIKEADAIILGPGSLYTSVIPNLLVKDIAKALKDTDALRLYVANIMTQPGESDGFTVKDHISAIFDHVGSKVIDYVVVNTGDVNALLKERYLQDNSIEVKLDRSKVLKLGVEPIEADFVKISDGYVRHHEDKLARVLIKTIMEKKLFYDRKKIVEYFYLSERLKENKQDRE